MSEPPRAHALPDRVRRQARRQPDRVAICDGDRTTTYGALDLRSHRVAQALYQGGLAPKERVAILDKDRDELFAVVFGVAKAGGVVLGLNWRLTAAELAFQLTDARVHTLFVGPDFLDRAAELAELCPGLRTIVAFAGGDTRWPTLVQFCDSAPAADPGVAVGPDDLAVQMYTSGTTGKPKGVMLAHRSFFAVVAAMKQVGDRWIEWHEHDVAMCGMPSFHIGGMWWAMTTFNAGACYIVLDAFAGWRVLRKIERHLVTKLCLVPAMLQVVLSEPDFAATDVSSLQYVVYGGAPIPRPALEQAMRGFGCSFAQIY